MSAGHGPAVGKALRANVHSLGTRALEKRAGPTERSEGRLPLTFTASRQKVAGEGVSLKHIPSLNLIRVRASQGAFLTNTKAPPNQNHPSPTQGPRKQNHPEPPKW